MIAILTDKKGFKLATVIAKASPHYYLPIIPKIDFRVGKYNIPDKVEENYLTFELTLIEKGTESIAHYKEI